MKKEFMTTMSRSFHKVGFKFKKHSPEILIVVGAVSTVAGAVMACKATLKVNDVIDEAKTTVDRIHEGVELQKHTVDGKQYTQEDANKDLTLVYVQTGWKFVKLYGPAVALGITGMGCMIGSNHILRKRNVALAAALTAVDTGFKEYRGRVIERFGKELDRELRYNIKAQEVEERVVDEDGNETVVTKTVNVVDPSEIHSMYSVVFCEGNKGWTRNAELNKVFLIQQQEAANFRFKQQGVLTLNEVYDMIGAQRTAYGQYAGWVYSDDPDTGDNFVDFGIFDVTNDKACDFVNGYEKSIILDFNCIGNVIPYM